MVKLRVFPMSVALGATWGIGVMFLGWVSGGGWGSKLVEVLSSLYVGYGSTFLGGIVGGIWAFVDAFFAGLVLTLLYNALAGHKGSAPVRGSSRSQTEQPAH